LVSAEPLTGANATCEMTAGYAVTCLAIAGHRQPPPRIRGALLVERELAGTAVAIAAAVTQLLEQALQLSEKEPGELASRLLGGRARSPWPSRFHRCDPSYDELPAAWTAIGMTRDSEKPAAPSTTSTSPWVR
jgi:hypothetical protein